MNVIEAKYPHIYRVAASLDLKLMAEPNMVGDDDNLRQEGVLVWIGDRGDPGANIPATEVTPTFHSLEELEEFCKKHSHEFAALAEASDWPEKLWWEE